MRVQWAHFHGVYPLRGIWARLILDIQPQPFLIKPFPPIAPHLHCLAPLGFGRQAGACLERIFDTALPPVESPTLSHCNASFQCIIVLVLNLDRPRTSFGWPGWCLTLCIRRFTYVAAAAFLWLGSVSNTLNLTIRLAATFNTAVRFAIRVPCAQVACHALTPGFFRARVVIPSPMISILAA